MTINSDSVSAAWLPPSGRLNRHDAEARQGRWMLELERGIFAANGKKTAASGANTFDRPQAPKIDAGVAAPDGQPQPDIECSDPENAVSPAARAGSDTSAAPVKVKSVLPVMHVQSQKTEANSVQFCIGRAPTTLFSAEESDAGRSPVSRAGQTTAAAMLPVASQVEFAPGLLDSEVQASAPGATPPDQQLGERPEFDKRLLNIYFKQDGVHAFIRDASLGAAQMPGLVQALASELGAAGRTLAALTVNGQAVDTPGDSESPMPSSSFPPFVRKGNPQ